MPQQPSEPEDQTLPSTPKDKQPVGEVIARKYMILSQLGQGGMGAVYKVRQIFLDEVFALKLLSASSLMNGAQMRRFQQEAKAARSLNHSNLVKVHDFGVTDNELPFLAMDYIEGQTLAEFLRVQGPLSIEAAKLLCTQLCLGLTHAHERGIIHRDIKPSNIMLVSGKEWGVTGCIKIVDFGIAKAASTSENFQPLTQTGEIFGSPFYMSPEQCLGTRVDHRSDIYSLGCVIFESLTGTPPFVGANSLRTMVLHETSPVPTLQEASLSKDFPETIEKIVAKMLAKSPEDRYQSASAVVDDLNQSNLLTVETIETGESKSKPGANRIAILAVALVLVASSLIAKFLLTRLAPAIVPPALFAHSVHGTSIQSDKAIVSNIRLKNKVLVRQFVFPEAPIGVVTTELLQDSKNFTPIAISASGTRDFPANLPLTFMIDFDKFPQGFSDEYKYIGTKEFFGLHLKAGSISKASKDYNIIEKQNKFLLDVLKTAKKWSGLHAVYLDQIALNEEWLCELDKLSSLENLLISSPSSGFVELKEHQAFHSAHAVWLIKTELEPFTKKLRGSTFLEHLVVLHCSRVTPESIDGLLDCTSLRTLKIAQPDLSSEIVNHLCDLEQVEILELTDTNLSIQLAEEILKNMKLKKLRLNSETLHKLNDAGLVDSRMIGVPSKRS